MSDSQNVSYWVSLVAEKGSAVVYDVNLAIAIREAAAAQGIKIQIALKPGKYPSWKLQKNRPT